MTIPIKVTGEFAKGGAKGGHAPKEFEYQFQVSSPFSSSWKKELPIKLFQSFGYNPECDSYFVFEARRTDIN